MNKPMYCPMSFRTSLHIGDVFECTPDCAWAVRDEQGESYACAVAANAVYGRGLYISNRPLKDEDDV